MRTRESARTPSLTSIGGSYQAETVRKLRAARLSAAHRRLRVSGLMAQSGWACLVFGLAPRFMFFGGNPIDAIVGPEDFWVTIAFVGLFLLGLSLYPTDMRAIRVVCAVVFVFLAGIGLLIIFFMPPSVGIPWACP